MRDVNVFFHSWPPSSGHTLTHVATVHCADDEKNPLDYAWRWTNNVEGSWSIKERELDGPDGKFPNGDFNLLVDVRCPLHVGRDGKTYGLRSSMIGDIYTLEGEIYEVAGIGFRRVL